MSHLGESCLFRYIAELYWQSKQKYWMSDSISHFGRLLLGLTIYGSSSWFVVWETGRSTRKTVMNNSCHLNHPNQRNPSLECSGCPKRTRPLSERAIKERIWESTQEYNEVIENCRSVCLTHYFNATVKETIYNFALCAFPIFFFWQSTLILAVSLPWTDNNIQSLTPSTTRKNSSKVLEAQATEPFSGICCHRKLKPVLLTADSWVSRTLPGFFVEFPKL